MRSRGGLRREYGQCVSSYRVSAVSASLTKRRRADNDMSVGFLTAQDMDARGEQPKPKNKWGCMLEGVNSRCIERGKYYIYSMT